MWCITKEADDLTAHVYVNLFVSTIGKVSKMNYFCCMPIENEFIGEKPDFIIHVYIIL